MFLILKVIYNSFLFGFGLKGFKIEEILISLKQLKSDSDILTRVVISSSKVRILLQKRVKIQSMTSR